MTAAATGPDKGARILATLLSLLAVLFFANAPIQATAMAFAADGDAALCAFHPDSGGDHKSPVDRQAACAACSICHLGGFAVLPASAAAPVSAVEIPLVRATRPAILNPRGPPHLAPLARGPPTLS